MTKIDEYRQELKQLDDWRPFLLSNSGLPGPRGNLELARAAAELANTEQAEDLVSVALQQSPENSPEVFLVFCGVTALGMQAARGKRSNLRRLRRFASDRRWRVREAVAIGLQYVGDNDMPTLLQEMSRWSTGNWYEKRAVAAALDEPRLLKDQAAAAKVLKLLDQITSSMLASTDRHEESFKVLRQSMGYCWSVAVAALPEVGQPLMERWFSSTDADIRWIMRENLKKGRLQRLDASWVVRSQKELEKGK